MTRPPGSRSPRGARRVLLVEDDLNSGRALSLSLKLRGYEVQWATTGRQALRALPADRRLARPDLVLLDLNLPDTDGVRLARRMRAKTRTIPPIIVVSGEPAEVREAAGRAVGASAVVGKPISLDELVAEIEGASREPARSAARPAVEPAGGPDDPGPGGDSRGAELEAATGRGSFGSRRDPRDGRDLRPRR